jgi:UDP-glucuronate 4-epimerase
LEAALGREAKKELLPMQPGDVVETWADVSAIAADYGFQPTTPLEAGISKFATWFKGWREQ